MRHGMIGAWVVLAASASLGLTPSSELKTLLIPDRAPEITGLIAPDHVLATDGDAAVVVVAADELDALSGLVHERFGGCGGFIDVSDDTAAGKSAHDILAFDSFLKQQTKEAATRTWPTVRFRDEIAALVAAVDSDRMWRFLTELSAFDNRSATTAMGGQAAQFLASRAQTVAAALPGFSVRTVATRGYPNQPSVVATLPGTDPTLPHVVIGGHMDTFSPGMPGADDDGSGSAVVMETLMAVVDQGARFQHTVDFIWYAAEERGLVGSTDVVRDFAARSLPVAAVIQFDMTGYKSPQDRHDIYIIDDYTNANLNQTLADVIGIFVQDASVGHSRCGYACSDHASWTRQQIPAVFPFESAFANYNNAIHSEQDSMELLDQEHATRFARVAAAFLGEIAVVE